MEAEALESILLPDVDTSVPPPGFNYPKPDFTQIDEATSEVISDKPAKPTFKNALQAKKRLQAFSSTRTGSLPSSPSVKKARNEEKKEKSKAPYHDDKAKAVIEEIEELKREEQQRISYIIRAKSRSRSRSIDKERFKKVEKKSRNYRKRSATPEKPKKVHKKVKKYPRDWKEFVEFDLSFDLNRDFDVATPKGNNDLLKQLLFEAPSLPINQFKMKTVKNEDKNVPFDYIRYTRAKPVVAYSVNFAAIKDKFLQRKVILNALPKNIAANIENLHSNSLRFKAANASKARNWFPKVWRDSENECKLLEKSVGLSFLQSYTEDEEEEKKDPPSSVVVDKKEKDEKSEPKKDDDKKKKKSETTPTSKKKKKQRDETSEKKKKRKKDKSKKKEKRRSKEKKPKQKKVVKEKKKKEGEKEGKPVVEKTKQQVLEELKIIEDKLAKKREQELKNKKEEKQQAERSRKRRHSEREDDAKRTKQEKHKIEEKKSKAKNEEHQQRKKKSRWSSEQVRIEDIPFPEKMNIAEEIKRIDEVIKKHEDKEKEMNKVEEEAAIPIVHKEKTPDTDEYHSHWESDEDVASKKKIIQSSIIKPNRSWESDEELFERKYNASKNAQSEESYTNLEIPLNIKHVSRKWNEEAPLSYELKLLEEERRNLGEERRKLEIEKQRILKMQEENGSKEDEPPPPPPSSVKIKKEMADFNLDSLNNSLLSNVSSTESNFPIAVLENEYEEFIKAVSSEPKKKQQQQQERKDSSSVDSSSSSSSSDSDHKKKKKKRKKRRRKKCEGLLLGKGATIFNEFDIPVPGDLPEIVPPTPVPVPEPPKVLLDTVKAGEVNKDPGGIDLTKPFVFSSIVLQSKKPTLVDNSKLKLDDDSDSADFTEKFAKKVEEGETKIEEKEEVKTETVQVQEQQQQQEEEKEEVKKETDAGSNKKEETTATEASATTKAATKNKEETKEKSSKKQRSRTRSRERRRGSPPPRRRRWSPRRRRSPPRRRRRSPSPSPPRRGRKRTTPSPTRTIRRASPLNSPLDGFKRSVADSTISDDMLPQPGPEDYNNEASPKRISLDDRINQVLGLEKNEPLPLQPPKTTTSASSEGYYNNYDYNQYNHQYHHHQYGQYQKNDYLAQFGQPYFAQPPPPIPTAKPVPPTKVVQVGNILQVVPTEDIEMDKPLETAQKIVQVGNMLQIVPAVIPPPPKPVVEPVPQPVQPPEKQSAEALMKQRKAEREKRRQERERRRKEKEKKRKEKEKRKQLKLKLRTENMIKRAIQLEAEALASEDLEEEGDNSEAPIQWPPVSVVVSTTSSCKGILLGEGSSRKKKSVQFADGVRPGEGTSPSGGEELSSPPPNPSKLPKEKRYKKIKVPKKSKKRKIKVKVVKKKASLAAQNSEEDYDDDYEDDNLPPPSPPPGSPPPHVFPSRVKTHTINNVHPAYVGNMIPNNPAGFPFRPPIPVVINRHQPPPGFIPGTYHADVNNLSHASYQGVSSHH